MGYFKKKTLNEIAEADLAKDYTEGYKFLPWLFWKKSGRVHFILGAILTVPGVYLMIDADSDYQSFQFIIASFFTAAGVFLNFWTYRMYRQMKKGISS